MLLGIPASSVMSERAFSKARLVDTRLRAQLGDEIFSDLLFMAKNVSEKDNSKVHQSRARARRRARSDVPINYE